VGGTGGGECSRNSRASEASAPLSGEEEAIIIAALVGGMGGTGGGACSMNSCASESSAPFSRGAGGGDASRHSFAYGAGGGDASCHSFSDGGAIFAGKLLLLLKARRTAKPTMSTKTTNPSDAPKNMSRMVVSSCCSAAL
jgi:hypothetical protein